MRDILCSFTSLHACLSLTCFASLDARAMSSCSSSSQRIILRYSVPMSIPCRFPYKHTHKQTCKKKKKRRNNSRTLLAYTVSVLCIFYYPRHTQDPFQKISKAAQEGTTAPRLLVHGGVALSPAWGRGTSKTPPAVPRRSQWKDRTLAAPPPRAPFAQSKRPTCLPSERRNRRSARGQESLVGKRARTGTFR